MCFERAAEMKPRARENRSGLTLIEIMVALLVIVVGVLGAMMYRYYSALDARKADVLVGASRVGLLVLEGWKGAVGNPAYDPQGVGGIGAEVLGSGDISISPASAGVHTVQLTGGTDTYYFVKLVKPSLEDVDGDGIDDAGIRKLEVEVTYYGQGSSDTSKPAKTIKLSDFVRTY